MGMPMAKWQERAKATYECHLRFKKSNTRWTIRDTAHFLDRSYGSVNDDINIMNWSRSHPKVLDSDSIQNAINLIKKKKKEMWEREMGGIR
jgi:hypothetical protein